MEFELVGWPNDGVTLDLDHREFGYAGKFVIGKTGKAVLRAGPDIVAAASFSPDRTEPDNARIRYITVRNDRQGEGLGPQLLATLTEHLLDDEYERATIAVNNPFAYEAAYRAGFAWTGEETGIAELVLSTDRPRDAIRYRSGLARFAERNDLTEDERSFLANRSGAEPPEPIARPPD